MSNSNDNDISPFLQWLLTTLAVFGIGVLLTAFYYGNFDVTSWPTESKGVLIAIVILMALFAT